MATKVVLKDIGNVLVVLPYYSTGAYGTWELPRVSRKETDAGEIVKQATGLDTQVLTLDSYTKSTSRGEDDTVLVAATRNRASISEGTFHCSMDVTSPMYPGHKFPLFVKAEFVPATKAVRMLKRSYAAIVTDAFGLSQDT